MDSPDDVPHSEYLRRQQPLERLRAHSRTTPLHRREKQLIWVIAAQLIFLPWAVGGELTWAQYVSLGFALAAFVLALLPRHYEAEAHRTDAFRLLMWPKLLRFPVFWLGLVFFGYVGVQMLNPAWHFMHGPGQSWWMQAIPYNHALPHGVAGVPWSQIPPLISVIAYLAAFLTVCAAWVGLTRRRSAVLLLTILVIDAALIACFAIVQRIAGNGLMFGFWNPGVGYFVGPFIYKNHAGEYFNLMIAVAAALGTYHFERTERRMLKSTPAGVFLFLAIVLGATELISYSRAATFLLLGYLIFLGVAFVIRMVRGHSAGNNPIVTISLLAILLAFVFIGANALRLGEAWDKAQELFAQDRIGSIEMREVAAKATWQMAGDAPWLGHGLGSFRFLFPAYQVRYPLITGSNNGVIRLFWRHAHNDYAEFSAELGILGLLPLIGMLGFWAFQLIKNGVWRHPPLWILALGLALTMMHSYVDFEAQNPAIIVTWCTLWPCLVRWLEFEEK